MQLVSSSFRASCSLTQNVSHPALKPKYGFAPNSFMISAPSGHQLGSMRTFLAALDSFFLEEDRKLQLSC